MEKDLLIIANGFVLTADPSNHGGRFDLLLRGGRISSVAPAGSFAREAADAQIIDATGKLIIPGLINAHFHPESLLLAPLTQGMHFGLWAQDVSLRSALAHLLDPSSRDDVRSLMLAASFAHIKSGTVAVADFPPAFDAEGMQTLGQSAQRADLRTIAVLQTWQQIEQARSGLGDARRFFLSLGADQDLTVYSLSNLARSSREMSLPLFAHVAEQAADEHAIRTNFQKNVGQVFHDVGILGPETVIAHGNHLRAEDLVLCEESGASLVLCARSASMKRTGYPLLAHLSARNIRCALGTDWGSTDLLEEMRFMAALPRLFPGVPAFSPLAILRMATINGASALGIEREVGSIESGKQADLVFLDVADLRVPRRGVSAGVREWAELLVTDLTARHISDVMIKGEFAMREGTLATMTEEDVLKGFDATLAKWYAAPGPAEEPAPPAPEPAADGKILPFVPKEATSPEEHDGFEEGFAIIGPQRGIPKTIQSSRRQERTAPEPPSASHQPELPGDVRREFGDDDA